MPFYTFEDKQGVERIVLIASADDAVKKYPIGEWRKLPGPDAPTLKRVLRVPNCARPGIQNDMEVHCMQVPKHLPEAPRVDEMGRAVLLSKREKEEFAAKIGAVDGLGIEPDTWDGY